MTKNPFILMQKGFYVTGNVSENKIDIDGEINGNIYCSGKVILRESSVVYGHIFAKKIEIKAGARGEFNIQIMKNLTQEDINEMIENSIEVSSKSPNIESVISEEIEETRLESRSSTEKKSDSNDSLNSKDQNSRVSYWG